jgi:SAM-dependent methyltransferase
MTNKVRPCQVCLSDNIESIFENSLAPVNGLDLSYSIGQCRQCGFHFANRLADDETISKYYSSLSKYDVTSSVSAWDLARIQSAIRILEPIVGKDERVVDLGCGFGALLAYMRDSGWTDLHGVDPGPKAAQSARDLFDIGNIHCATMGTAHTVLPLDQADLVCIMAVLEHLPSLHDDMQALISHLRPGCRILVEVPALDLFKARAAEPFGEFSLEHIQFFSATSLRNFFAGLGSKAIVLENVALPMLQSGSLFGLFENLGSKSSDILIEHEDDQVFREYVEGSRETLNAAMQKIPDTPFLIYGAGSHTARLLPYLEITHSDHLLGIVDGNTNLVGKTMGRWTIQPPDVLTTMPNVSVLVSSFRSQIEIASSLESRFTNNLVLMYA